MRPVFKYGVTACAMLLAGAYFAGVSRGSFSIIVFGYILGSLLGYVTAEILLQKSLRVWSAYRGYLGYVAVITVLLLGITTDATGYVHRVPEPENVNKVYFGTNIGEWMRLEKLNNTIDQNAEYMGGNFFEDRNNIRNILLLHRQLLQSPLTENGIDYYIVYTLDNGDYLARRYSIDEKRYASLLKPVYESLEYKQARFPVVTQDPANIKLIEIGDDRTPKRPVVLADSAEIREFAARLKQDVLHATFEELTANWEENVHINIVDVNEKPVHYNLRDSYRSVISWLKDKGYYESIMLLPEEIEYATLERPTVSEGYKTGPASPASKRVEIRERRLIEELLSVSGPDEFTNAGKIITVTFYGRTIAGSFQFKRSIHRDWPASASLREYMKQLD